MPLYIKL